MARAAGIQQAACVSDLREFEEMTTKALRDPGPWLITAQVDGSDRNSGARGQMPEDLVEQAVLFQRELRRRGISPFGNTRA